MWYKWLIFALLIIFIPFGVAGLLSFGEKKLQPTEAQKKNSYKNASKLILFYWLCDLFYMSFIIENKACKFIFGGLTMLIILFNLCGEFVSQASKKNNLLGKWGLLQDFIVGVGISVYLIYIISNTTLQTIVLAITAAIYGGMLTLIGVAWTIRRGDENRRTDLVLQNKPIMYAQMFTKKERMLQNRVELAFHGIDECEKYVSFGSLVNTDNSIVIVEKLLVDGKEYFPINNNVIAKHTIYDFVVSVPELADKSVVTLYVKDVLNTAYSFEMMILKSEYVESTIPYNIFSITSTSYIN